MLEAPAANGEDSIWIAGAAQNGMPDLVSPLRREFRAGSAALCRFRNSCRHPRFHIEPGPSRSLFSTGTVEVLRSCRLISESVRDLLHQRHINLRLRVSS